jgi:hypothetical protein
LPMVHDTESTNVYRPGQTLHFVSLSEETKSVYIPQRPHHVRVGNLLVVAGLSCSRAWTPLHIYPQGEADGEQVESRVCVPSP